jgi:ferritin-like metal-binding protein YciE
MSRTPKEQLVHFLSDMYSMEQQALAQLVSAPKIAGDAMLAAEFAQHHTQTEQQADLVRQRLEAHGGSASAIKDAIMKLGGKGFLLFARVMPETPGRLVAHAYSYEAMEWAGYEMLRRFAQHAGDLETANAAEAIGAQERAMMERLEQGFDAAEAVSHRGMAAEQLKDHVEKHLGEVHAFESQAIQLLKKSDGMAGNAALQGAYRQCLERTEEHAGRVEQRLSTLSSNPSMVKDAALRMGGLNWSLFFQAQSDTPAKLAAFVYAVLHLEIGGYALLQRTARRAGDAETHELCQIVLEEKQGLADVLSGTFDAAVQATLDELQA